MARRNENGIALVTALLMTALVSALLVGFISTVTSDQRTGLVNRDQTTAYAAAHAGLEQLTADLGNLFARSYRPTAAQINELDDSLPDIHGVDYATPGGEDGTGYRILFNDTAPADGFPDTEATPRTITSGPYEGLQGTVTPYSVEVTAHTETGAETRMRRTVQTVLIPVFQFGVFSETDLSFHAGPSFDFGGRVHTNGNLYLASGATLWLRDRVTAFGEVVRKNMVNGWLTSSGYAGTVKIARYAGDTTGATMAMTDQSWKGAAGSIPPAPQEGVTPSPGSNDPAWSTFSVTTAKGMIKNQRTGAKQLVLPLVQMGAQPIDLIRRPQVNSNENVANQPVYDQRYFSRASLRILLSDTQEDILDLPGVTNTPPRDLRRLGLAWLGAGWPNIPTARTTPHPAGCYNPTTLKYVTCGTSATGTAPTDPAGVPNANWWAPSGAWLRPNAGNPEYEALITGFIKIEMQRDDATWVDVTDDVLKLGYTGRRLSATNPPNSNATNFTAPVVYADNQFYLNNTVWGTAPNNGATACAGDTNNPSPNAIIRIQRVRDDTSPKYYNCGKDAGGVFSPQAIDYIPLALFDAREGDLRRNSTTSQNVYLGGVMHYIELDVTNLARWFVNQIGTGLGPQAEFSDGGYLVYVSDRRGNRRVNGLETGEYGFEDFVNPLDSTNGLPNGVLDQGEDVNAVDADNNGSNLDSYGNVPDPNIIAPVAPAPAVLRVGAQTQGLALDGTRRVQDRILTREARVNPPLFFRRAVKIVNAAGAPGNTGVSPLTILPTGRGLTIVAENPVYVQGNYNTGTAGTFGSAQTDHRPSAIIADAITLLSNNWNDLRSFVYTNAGTQNGSQNITKRVATETWYRMAVVSGKGVPFPHPSWETSDESFGSDGGVHNFLRYLEDWLSGSINVHYRGSIVSFYSNRQAVGTFKYDGTNGNTYGAPVRDFAFDTEFLQLSLLPPKSPAFRDVNTLTFRQVLRPTQ